MLPRAPKKIKDEKAEVQDLKDRRWKRIGYFVF